MLARPCLAALLLCVFVRCDCFRPHVLQLQHEVSLRCQSLVAMQCASDSEPNNRPTWPTFRVTTDAERETDTRLMRLERRVSALECT